MFVLFSITIYTYFHFMSYTKFGPAFNKNRSFLNGIFDVVEWIKWRHGYPWTFVICRNVNNRRATTSESHPSPLLVFSFISLLGPLTLFFSFHFPEGQSQTDSKENEGPAREEKCRRMRWRRRSADCSAGVAVGVVRLWATSGNSCSNGPKNGRRWVDGWLLGQ